MDSEAQKAVESAFVGARQANPKVAQDDLHEWITHARLIALSHGESKLTRAAGKSLEKWEAAKAASWCCNDREEGSGKQQ